LASKVCKFKLLLACGFLFNLDNRYFWCLDKFSCIRFLKIVPNSDQIENIAIFLDHFWLFYNALDVNIDAGDQMLHKRNFIRKALATRVPQISRQFRNNKFMRRFHILSKLNELLY